MMKLLYTRGPKPYKINGTHLSKAEIRTLIDFAFPRAYKTNREKAKAVAKLLRTIK